MQRSVTGQLILPDVRGCLVQTFCGTSYDGRLGGCSGGSSIILRSRINQCIRASPERPRKERKKVNIAPIPHQRGSQKEWTMTGKAWYSRRRSYFVEKMENICYQSESHRAGGISSRTEVTTEVKITVTRNQFSFLPFPTPPPPLSLSLLLLPLASAALIIFPLGVDPPVKAAWTA